MKFKEARRVMRRAFKEDSDLKEGYIANVSMHLYDEFIDPASVSGIRESSAHNMKSKTFRDQLSTEIIDLIFRK